jgi:alkanesulfonate monooxygenase SsuD/methylene tetrahydromethanopterin reductase-like flavin-dependent oxidoreductase (luciferase family)
MQIGIGLPNVVPGTPGRLLLDWARRADELEFTTLATIDRIAYPSYESLIALAGAGAVTERIELLTNILLAPTRNPVLLAKEAASVDQISGGRLTLGLGVGRRGDDFVAAERSFEDRGRRFDRDLEVMHSVWRGEPVGDSGKPAAPEPTQDGRVPILIGGTSDRAIERTVKWGMGWTAGGQPAEQVEPLVQRVREAWEQAGRPGQPRLVALSYFAMQEEKEEESRGSILDYYTYLGDFAQQMADGVPRGPAAIRETAEKFEAIGVDQLSFHPTVADVREVDLLAEAVL